MTTTLPKAALAILALPGVESLEKEPDGWCCHLRYGWTTDALSGGGTIIDSNLATIRAFVRGAYRMADAETMDGPILPGEQRPPAAPFKHDVTAPTIGRATVANGAALHTLKFHLTEKSANAKTGAMAVSTSSKATCSPSCPFLDSGCYAQSGPLNLHWLKVTSGERGTDFPSFLKKLAALPADSAFRYSQAGDIPHTLGKISRTFIRRMVESVGHLRAYTYTHHDVKLGENLQLLRYANRNGFTVNVSCQTERQVDDAITAGLPAVLVVPSDEKRTTWRTADGNAVLVCPAQRSDSKTCVDCMLCHKRGKKVAIAFLAHGTGKRKAEAALAS